MEVIIKSSVRNVCFVLVAITVVSLSGSAQTQKDKTLSPYFFVQGDPNVDHLPLKDTRVEIDVSGVIADVKVLQAYRNEGSRPINARYVCLSCHARCEYYAHLHRIAAAADAGGDCRV